MFAKSTGGHVKTICVETSDGERDCRVAFLSDMAKLIGYQVSVYAGVERVVVTLIKPVVQLTPYEREAVHYEAHIYKFSA
jgi:hypothetical protein